MKNLYLLTVLVLLISCSVQKKKETRCNENIEFKELFFSCIETAENHTRGKKIGGSFLGSLDFINMYVKVEYGKIYNYQIGYSTYEDFKEDKDRWLKWYEENKCKNIQIKQYDSIGVSPR